MPRVRTGKDVYCGCSERGYYALEIGILTLIAVVTYGILILTVLGDTPPSSAPGATLKVMDGSGAVVSRTGEIAAAPHCLEVGK